METTMAGSARLGASLRRYLLTLAAGVGCLVLAQEAGAQSDATTGAAGASRAERPAGKVATLPRFASLRASEVNLRTGPGTRYPIDWVYRRRDLPVEIIDEFDTWRRIRDSEGTVGWVHQSMLHGRRFVVVVGEQALLRRDPQEGGRGLAMLEPGVVGAVESCGGGWCVVEIQGYKGWLKREEVYGVYPDEAFP